MKNNLISFLNKIKVSLKSFFIGRALVTLLLIVGIVIFLFLIWAINSYSGSVECIRPETDIKPSAILYYEYNINGISRVKYNYIDVNESMVRDYEDFVGTGFTLVPNRNLKKILKYEATSTCK